MMLFADRTGLSSDRPARRYLWTDAFAVCNFLGLSRATGDGRYQELALRLVDQVHVELGRYRTDDRRVGWLSGLPDAEAAVHPTSGGLRIGKLLPERTATEPLDPELEWERDGQYFHYLTKWMHALDQVSRSTGDIKFTVWARELAVAAHRAFTHGPRGARRMFWKLSTDLSRPLVSSMGHHDPLDGVVTCAQLGATAAALGSATGPSLAAPAAELGEMLDRGALATSDPLGLGGLLVDACRLAQIDARHELIPWLLAAAVAGVRRYVAEPELRADAHARLAFRELGLAIGLAGISLESETFRRGLGPSGEADLAVLAQYVPLRSRLETFWLRPNHRHTPTWLGHEDINDVMLATSLAPEGFLTLSAPKRASSTDASTWPAAVP